LEYFTSEIAAFKKAGHWSREDLIDLFCTMIPEFAHKETGKFLDGRV
jgi:hypothetical protein